MVWLRAISGLALVAFLLLALYYVVRFLSQGRLLTLGRARLMTVIESTFLAQNTSIHVVKMGGRYFLIGAGSGHVALISEIPPEEVEPFVEARRRALELQTTRLGAIFKRKR